MPAFTIFASAVRRAPSPALIDMSYHASRLIS